MATLFRNVKDATLYLMVDHHKSFSFDPNEEKEGPQELFKFTSSVATGENVVLARVSGDTYVADAADPAMFMNGLDTELATGDWRELVEFVRTVLFGGRLRGLVKQTFGIAVTDGAPATSVANGLYFDPETERVWKVVSSTVTEITAS